MSDRGDHQPHDAFDDDQDGPTRAQVPEMSSEHTHHHHEPYHDSPIEPTRGHEHSHRSWLETIFHLYGDRAGLADPRATASDQGIRALKLSIVGLLFTASLQVVVVAFSGSVALLADTVHNFGDALTSVPLWIAFSLGRRPSNRRYTYGYARAEDLAGIVIVGVIIFSAAFAGYEAYLRFVDQRSLQRAEWVIAAAIIGFAGNELVARFRIGVGRDIGSAALVADGQHARVDGLTSLSVIVSAVGALAGFPILDPIVGMLITVAILLVARTAMATMWERVMDAVDPSLVVEIEQTARDRREVLGVHRVRVRWLGHRLQTAFCLQVDAGLSTAESHAIAERVRHDLFHTLPRLADVFIHIDPVDPDGTDHHATTTHHEQH